MQGFAIVALIVVGVFVLWIYFNLFYKTMAVKKTSEEQDSKERNPIWKRILTLLLLNPEQDDPRELTEDDFKYFGFAFDSFRAPYLSWNAWSLLKGIILILLSSSGWVQSGWVQIFWGLLFLFLDLFLIAWCRPYSSSHLNVLEAISILFEFMFLLYGMHYKAATNETEKHRIASTLAVLFYLYLGMYACFIVVELRAREFIVWLFGFLPTFDPAEDDEDGSVSTVMEKMSTTL